MEVVAADQFLIVRNDTIVSDRNSFIDEGRNIRICFVTAPLGSWLGAAGVKIDCQLVGSGASQLFKPVVWTGHMTPIFSEGRGWGPAHHAERVLAARC